MYWDNNIEQRIRILCDNLPKLADYLTSALEYSVKDPRISLIKSRIVLENILHKVFYQEMGKPPKRTMIGNILSDKTFYNSLPKRISTRMKSIKDMGNIGAHNEIVHADDAKRVLPDLVEVLEWYVEKYDLDSQLDVDTVYGKSKLVEILPQLRQRYEAYLREEISSVKFGQSENKCFLEITVIKESGDLLNVLKNSTDLGFITQADYDDHNDDPFFDPNNPIANNIEYFIEEFGEIAIINCTNLFTKKAETFIYNYWMQHGITP